MKKNIREFFRRGCVSLGFGPMILAILYLVLHRQGVLQILTVRQVCIGIFSLSSLAFVAGGMNAIYQIERLPLLIAVLIHGSVLYISYLITYLVNGWLEWGTAPVMVFTVIFTVGYFVIWAIISCMIKKRTDRINAILKSNRQTPGAPSSDTL